MAEKCHVCNKLCDKNDVKVRDHCHVTGKCKGSAHQSCNLSFWLSIKIPIIFDNFRRYDGHDMM